MRSKNLWQTVLFFCTASGAAISYSDLTPYNAIVSATAAGVSAWIAFRQRGARLVRYTQTVRQLEQLLAWWHAKSAAEKSAKVNYFVTTAELIITSEGLAGQDIEQNEEEPGSGKSDARSNMVAEKKRGGKTRDDTERNGVMPFDIETGQQ